MNIYVVMRKGSPDCAFTNTNDAATYCYDQNIVEGSMYYWYSKVELNSEYDKPEPKSYEIEYDDYEDDWSMSNLMGG